MPCRNVNNLPRQVLFMSFKILGKNSYPAKTPIQPQQFFALVTHLFSFRLDSFFEPPSKLSKYFAMISLVRFGLSCLSTKPIKLCTKPIKDTVTVNQPTCF